MLPPVPADAVIVEVFKVNVAVTVLAALIVTVHEPVPVQAPDQPPNVELASGAAVRVTLVPAAYTSVQSDPQLMPAGADVTIPSPVPAFVTLRLFCGTAVKVALIV